MVIIKEGDLGWGTLKKVKVDSFFSRLKTNLVLNSFKTHWDACNRNKNVFKTVL